MPIQENALNSALAAALSAHELHATPEQTRVKTGGKRCDVQIRRRHGDRYFTALECKIGQGSAQGNRFSILSYFGWSFTFPADPSSFRM